MAEAVMTGETSDRPNLLGVPCDDSAIDPVDKLMYVSFGVIN